MRILVLSCTLCVFVQTELPAEIRATWPEGGGVVTVFSDRSYDLGRNLEFRSEKRLLRGGANPAPFRFIIADGAETNRILLGALESVVIDGIVELDVRVHEAARDGDIYAEYGWWQFPDPLPITISAASIPRSPIRGEYPQQGGPLTLTASGPVQISSLVLTSAGDNLIFGSPEPFETLHDRNRAGELRLSGGEVVIDGRVTLVVHVSADVPIGDITAGYNGSPGSGIFPMVPVPEPSGAMLIWGFIWLSSIRLVRPNRPESE